MRTPLLAFSLIPIFLLAGCGTKGPLTLPPGPDKPPLFGRSAPIPSPVIATPAKPNMNTSAAHGRLSILIGFF